MLSARKPPGERGVLLVPVLPGSVLRSVEPAREREPPSQRVMPVAAGLGGALALIAVAVVLLSRGGEGKHAASPPAPTVSQPARVVVHSAPAPAPTSNVAPKPRVTAAQRARAAAVRLAAHLPVKLQTAALLPAGTSVYIVGGTSLDGTPSNGIWQLDLHTGKVTAAGTFVEPLTGAAAAARDGVLYLAGGWTGTKLATGVLRWSPGQSSSLVTRLPGGLRDARAAFVGTTLYVSGGSAPQAYAVDIGTGSVTTVSKVPAGARPRSNLALLAAAVG